MPIELTSDLTLDPTCIRPFEMSVRRFDYSQTSRIPVPIELKSDLTFLDPIRPFEMSATRFDYSQTSRIPVSIGFSSDWSLWSYFLPFGAVCDKFLLLADFQESGVTTVASKP